MDLEPASDEFCEMLQNATLAGACRIAARLADTSPEHAVQLMEDADELSEMAATMLQNLKGGSCLQARPPCRRR